MAMAIILVRLATKKALTCLSRRGTRIYNSKAEHILVREPYSFKTCCDMADFGEIPFDQDLDFDSSYIVQTNGTQ